MVPSPYGLIVEPNAEKKETSCEEPQTHSFILKIWLEETEEESGAAMWRGRITHVPSGERRYVKELTEIELFLLPYLESMKVRLGTRWKIWKWLFRPSS